MKATARKRPAKRRRNTLGVYSSAAPGVAIYKRNMEIKFNDVSVTDEPIVDDLTAFAMLDPITNGTISGVDQGDGESQRNGRMYTIHSIEIHGFVSWGASASDVEPMREHQVRLWVVLDRQSNQEQMIAQECMLPIAVNLDVNAYPNLKFAHRFTILKDVRMTLVPTLVFGDQEPQNMFHTGRVVRPFNCFYTFRRGLNVLCTGVSSTVDDIMNNSLHVFGVRDAMVSGTQDIRLSYTARTRFTG